jgi:hypothetical protein
MSEVWLAMHRERRSPSEAMESHTEASSLEDVSGEAYVQAEKKRK